MLTKIASFFFMLILILTSLFGAEMPGYEKRELLGDGNFSDGFRVLSSETNGNEADTKGIFTYDGAENEPVWMIAQWNSGPCLWDDRQESDEFTITDGKTKWVTYNKTDSSVSMRLDASAIYEGKPAGYESWPHLLLEQSPIVDYFSLSDEEKAFYNLEDNRIVLELKLKMTDFKEVYETDGVKAVQFLTYFYLKDTDGDNFIWFGADLFDNRGLNDTVWAKDSVGGNMIYCISTKETYGSAARTLLKNGKPVISDEWVTLKLDLTPHLADCIEKANRDNIFSEEVSLSDFYIGGTNIGFEIHGNFDCTFAIKDFSLTSYKK